jgi:hypothetical protein
MVAKWVNHVVYLPFSEGKSGGGNWGGKNSGGLCLWAAPPSPTGRKLPDLLHTNHGYTCISDNRVSVTGIGDFTSTGKSAGHATYKSRLLMYLWQQSIGYSSIGDVSSTDTLWWGNFQTCVTQVTVTLDLYQWRQSIGYTGISDFAPGQGFKYKSQLHILCQWRQSLCYTLSVT